MHSVSERALIARINRRLQPVGESVRTCRESSRWFHDFGRHYVVNDRNLLVAKDVDIDAWAADLEIAARVVC